MTTKTMTEKFEEAFLDGKNRENVLVSSQLNRGADGEYFNPNTRALFAFFCKGAASVVVELPGVDTWSCRSEAIHVYKRECQEAIQAAGGTVKP